MRDKNPFENKERIYTGIKKVKSIKDIPKRPGMTEDLRSSKNHVYIFTSLFYETGFGKNNAIFTLGEEDCKIDGLTYYSLKKRYLDSDDPTGYEFAMQWIGSWKHWERLKNSDALRSYVEDWEDEHEVKLRSKKLKLITEDDSFQANRFIVERGWAKKMGRPKKADIEREARRKADIRDNIADDAKRVGLLN